MLRIVFSVFIRIKKSYSELRHYLMRNYLKLLSMFVIWVVMTSQSPFPKSINKFPVIFKAILSNWLLISLGFDDLSSLMRNSRKN